MLKNMKTCLLFVCLLMSCVFIDASKLRSKLKKAKIRMTSKNNSKYNCSTQNILHFDGKCVNVNPSGIHDYLPSDFAAAWSVLAPIIESAMPVGGPTFCLGDFNGSDFGDNDDLDTDLCTTIPVVDDGGKYGVVGMSMEALPCGKPTDATFCLTFDLCGTFAIAFNAGFPTCVATITGSTTGIIAAAGAAASLVADTIPNFSIGVSLTRRFATDVRLAYRSGDGVHSDTITTYGHIFADLGVSFPTDAIKIGNKDIGDYISFDADILFLVDFGDVDTVVQAAVNSIKSLSKDKAISALKALIKSGPEITLNINGVLTINLEELSKGALCDLSFTLASVQVLLTGGSGRSGLETGFYIRVGSDAVSDMINSLQGIFDNYMEIFEKLGLGGSFTVPPVGVELGLFLSKSSFGFQITFFGVKFKCLLIFDGFQFSCSINANIFSIIADAANFVIKKVSKFFETSGSVLMTKTQESFKQASKAISKSVKAAVGFIKNGEGKLISIASSEFIDYTAQYKEKLKLLKTGVKQVSRLLSKITSAVVNIAKKKAEIVLCNLKINKKKRKKCKKSVNDKYDKDNNSEDCEDFTYKYTGYIDNSMRNIRNFNIDCSGTGFISSATLQKKDDKYRYRYSCTDVNDSNDCYTDYATAPSDNVSYLDAWSNSGATCKENYGLSYLKWQNQSGKAGFTYKCCKLNNKNIGCIKEESESISLRNNDLDTLVDEDLAPSDHNYIRSFNLKKLGSDELIFEMYSCTINSLVITSHDTGCIDEDGGNIFVLTNHEVKCGSNEFINQFQLKRTSSQIQYAYKCVYNHTMTNTCVTKYTDWNSTDSDKRKSIHYLDRHDVSCPDNNLMRSFVLENDGSKIRYKYECCQAPIKSCENVDLSWEDTNDFRSYYLDRLNVDSNSRGGGINQFKLSRRSKKDDIKYSYTVCSL